VTWGTPIAAAAIGAASSAASFTTSSGRHDFTIGSRSTSAAGALISPDSFANPRAGRSSGGSAPISG
jgi:hypothetical protein